MKALISGILLIFLFSTSHAQSLRNAGTVELGGDISYSSYSESGSSESTNIFSFNPYIGYMIGGGWEPALRLSITSGNFDATSFGAYFAPSYNFSSNNGVVPYLEFLVGYATLGSGEYSAKGLGVGGDAGMKITVGSSALVLVKFEYLHQNYTIKEPNYNYYYSYNGYSEEVTYKLNTVTFGVGFRVFIGGPSSSAGKAPPKTN